MWRNIGGEAREKKRERRERDLLYNVNMAARFRVGGDYLFRKYFKIELPSLEPELPISELVKPQTLNQTTDTTPRWVILGT